MINVRINGHSNDKLQFKTKSDLQSYLKELEKENLITNLIYINGQSVETNIGQYIKDHFDEINLLEITLRKKTEFNKELVTSLLEYLENAIPQLDSLSDAFYLTPSKADWTRLADLIEAFDYILKALNSISISNNSYFENWDNEIESIRRILNELAVSLEHKDKVLLADIIIFEVKDSFVQLVTKLKNHVIFEGNSDEFN
ncbi:hypothetical protein ACFO0S_06370 [Chryseomicrobium palamuruense]|uniref:Uncharacterized protein n=1 Tax=Chryseomicrobium palamuruense TaxID=682973 RepID=A0ABV8UUU2_9BACL